MTKILDISDKSKNALAVVIPQNYILERSEIKISSNYKNYYCDDDGLLKELDSILDFEENINYLKIDIHNASIIEKPQVQDNLQNSGGVGTNAKILAEIFVKIKN